MGDCHCGKKVAFADCCEPVLDDLAQAKSAEAVMRARYSAYVTGNIDFLHDSLHPSGRDDFDHEATEKWAESSSWNGLKILATQAGTVNDKTGTVDFTARFLDADGEQQQHSERSHFRKLNNEWFFCDGQSIAPDKVGRNDPCPCGSGKKYKKCCSA